MKEHTIKQTYRQQIIDLLGDSPGRYTAGQVSVKVGCSVEMARKTAWRENLELLRRKPTLKQMEGRIEKLIKKIDAALTNAA